MARIVQSELVARGLTFDGRNVNVFVHTHDDELRGVGKETFSVDVSGNATNPPVSYGFMNENDALAFVHSSNEVNTKHADHSGNVETVKRQGLGIPSGMVTKFKKNSGSVKEVAQ